jgi:cellulose synthase/poly-beta-1,6-N-acetylglucosamine synthase-like glycosyltransferase
MIHLLEISNLVLFYYYVICNVTYLLMLIIALRTSAAHFRKLQSVNLNWPKSTPLAPPVTIVVPAHN